MMDGYILIFPLQYQSIISELKGEIGRLKDKVLFHQKGAIPSHICRHTHWSRGTYDIK